jgi:hypothetical protein
MAIRSHGAPTAARPDPSDTNPQAFPYTARLTTSSNRLRDTPTTSASRMYPPARRHQPEGPNQSPEAVSMTDPVGTRPCRPGTAYGAGMPYWRLGSWGGPTQLAPSQYRTEPGEALSGYQLAGWPAARVAHWWPRSTPSRPSTVGRRGSQDPGTSLLASAAAVGAPSLPEPTGRSRCAPGTVPVGCAPPRTEHAARAPCPSTRPVRRSAHPGRACPPPCPRRSPGIPRAASAR